VCLCVGGGGRWGAGFKVQEVMERKRI
jgi:hypothetical protein